MLVMYMLHASNSHTMHILDGSVRCMAVRRLQHIHYKHLVPPNLYELGGTKNFFRSLRSRIQDLYPPL